VFKHIDEMQVTKIEKIRSETLDHVAPWCWSALGLGALALLLALGVRATPW
jgi:hypothetical protein